MKKKKCLGIEVWKKNNYISSSAYDVFVLLYNKFSEADEKHINGNFDSMFVFLSFEAAEDFVHFQVRHYYSGLLPIKDEDIRFDHDKRGVSYVAYNEDKSDHAEFVIVPSACLK